MPNTLLPRIAARLSAPDDPPDVDLLARFVADRDAFALLVRVPGRRCHDPDHLSVVGN